MKDEIIEEMIIDFVDCMNLTKFWQLKKTRTIKPISRYCLYNLASTVIVTGTCDAFIYACLSPALSQSFPMEVFHHQERTFHVTF